MLMLAQVYPGWNGFLGTRGSFMLDVVFLAMFAVVPATGVSIWLVKRGKYEAHKKIQVLLGIVLAIAVTAFELDMRFGGGWRERAAASQYWVPGAWNFVWTTLTVHLFFAVPTALLWIFVIVQGLRKFPHPPTPCAYSVRHKFWAWPAAIGMLGTAVTGWIFYWAAFVA